MISFDAQTGVLQLCAVVLLSATGMAQAESCRAKSFSGASYAVCSFNLAKDRVRTFWRGNDGNPYRTFDALAADLEAKGKSLRFAMNGGMYRGDLSPVGLYIEDGRMMVPPNTVTLTGAQSQIPNFYKSRRRQSWHFGDGTLSCRKARGEFRDSVRADAPHQREDSPGLHRQFNRSQAAGRRGFVEPERNIFRHHQKLGELLRLCQVFS